jgi:hypothetical protein
VGCCGATAGSASAADGTACCGPNGAVATKACCGPAAGVNGPVAGSACCGASNAGAANIAASPVAAACPDPPTARGAKTAGGWSLPHTGTMAPLMAMVAAGVFGGGLALLRASRSRARRDQP